MTPSRPSLTAEGVAAVRAAEMVLRRPGRRVFEDPVACRLLAGYRRLALKTGPLLRALVWMNGLRYAGMVDEVLARASYAQGRLDRLAEGGVRQAVLVGAGFDATGWRASLPEDLVVYEIDHPATQELKRRRMAAAGLTPPRRVVYVPADLEGEDLPDLLSRAGHRRGEPTFVTMLGLLPYLSARNVRRAISGAAVTLAPGSEIVYGFLGRVALDVDRRPRGIDRAARRVDRCGEPFLFAADPDEMARLLEAAGLRPVETLDGTEITRRFFAARGDRRRVDPAVHLGRAVPR